MKEWSTADFGAAVLRICSDLDEYLVTGVPQLRFGMILDEDVVSTDGTRLLSKGQEVTRPILLRLQVISNGVGVAQPFRVVTV